MVVVSLLVPVINISTSNSTSVTNEGLTHLSTAVISHQQIGVDGLIQYLINASLPYVVMVWAFTVLFLSFRLIRSWVQLAAIKHDCDPRTSSQLKQYIKNIAIKLDLPTIPMLKISRQVMIPAAYGLFKPTILLPLSLINQIPKEQLEAIIKHELCHLKRNDFVHNIIQLCADILLFFHPGIRWMNNDIRHIREQCCDQMVLSHDTEKLTYAKALTNIAAFSNGMNIKPSIQLGINDGMLLNRVKFLLQNNSSQSSLMIFIPFLMLIMFMIVMLQPANNEFDERLASQNSSINNTAWPTEKSDPPAIQQKRMSNRSFYPKFDTPPAPDSITNTLRESVESEQFTSFEADQAIPDREAESVPFKSLDRNSLLNDIKLDIQLPTTNLSDAEIFPTEHSSKPDLMQQIDANLTAASPLNVAVVEPTDDNLLNSTALIANTSELSSFDNKDIIKPEFKRYVAPKYPQYFWYNQIEQEVIATFKIQPNGRAYDINLTSQINNFVAFEQEVEKAIKRWKFDTSSLNNSTLQRTYQQIFSFVISDEIIKNCEQKTTGTRLSKPMPCNK